MAYLQDFAIGEGVVADHALRGETPSRAFTSLEVSALLTARLDSYATLLDQGRAGRLLRFLFGGSPTSPSLADPRLEALRRAAVYAWHHRNSLPAAEQARMLAAGFGIGTFDRIIRYVASYTAR